MKSYFRFTALLLSTFVLCLPVHVTAADDSGFMNSVTESGQCGHEGVGKLMFLSNSDKANGYEVTLKATATHEGKSDEKMESHSIKAGGKEHLGCSFSDIMPLTHYTWEIVSETKSP